MIPVTYNFNPRTREGCDTRGLSGVEAYYMDFNPRTREGCDGLQIGSVTICSLINHIASRLKGSSIFESIIRVLLIFIEIKTSAKLRYILCVILLRTAFSLG